MKRLLGKQAEGRAMSKAVAKDIARLARKAMDVGYDPWDTISWMTRTLELEMIRYKVYREMKLDPAKMEKMTSHFLDPKKYPRKKKR